MHDPVVSGLLVVGLLIATFLYFAMIRRRASDRRSVGGRTEMLESYGRSGLP